METCHKIFTKDSTVVLSTDSDLFNLLKRAVPKSKGPPIPIEITVKPTP